MKISRGILGSLVHHQLPPDLPLPRGGGEGGGGETVNEDVEKN